jgi:hypothetical protein
MTVIEYVQSKLMELKRHLFLTPLMSASVTSNESKGHFATSPSLQFYQAILKGFSTCFSLKRNSITIVGLPPN